MNPRTPLRAGLLFSVALASRTSFAAEPDTTPRIRDDSTVTHGMAEFGVGSFILPNAVVCTEKQAICSKGDASLAFSGLPLFRRGGFAAGAGLMMGITSSSNSPRNDSPDVPRSHTRRYFAMEATARYYLPIVERVEAWGGATAGLGVINDTFLSLRGLGDEAVVGPRGATILTEAFTCGLGLGLAYTIAQNWRLGVEARGSFWFLPETPATDPRGDLASLTGPVLAIDLALTLGYRTRLVF